MNPKPKTVWILGSGFSKGIGAPLLYQLLSEKQYLLATEVFPNTPDRTDVYQLFGNYGPASTVKYWEHAEEFLDLVDAASEHANSPRRKFIEKLLLRINNKITLEDFRDLAALAIATEVNAYVEIGSLTSEAWKPYLHWAKQLDAQDSIITFNYDTLLEKLGHDKAVAQLKDDGVLLPHQARAIPEGRCRIFKLHGSATWAWDEKAGERFKDFGSTGGFNFKDGYRPLIGTPGSTKQNHVERHFENIWKQAMMALQQAEVVVFMGYRFPPSDSYARRALLNTLTLNMHKYLRFHTVLGPEVTDTPTLRLNALLRETLNTTRHDVDEPDLTVGGKPSRYSLKNHPLYAEDFMSVLNGTTLTREPMNQPR